MATAFHASGLGSQTTGLASFSITCTISAGDQVVVYGSWDSVSTTTPTVATTGGTGSDAFTLAYGPFTNGNFKYGVWLLASAGSGRTGATISWASSNPSFADGYCDSFTGVASPTLDGSASASGSAAGAVSSGNTATLTSADEFAIAYAAAANAIIAVGGSWTSDVQQPTTGSWGAHQVLSATTPIASNFTNSASGGAWVSYALTFKSGVAAAATTSGKTPPNIFRPKQGPRKGLKPTQAFPAAVSASTPVNVSVTGVAITASVTQPTVTGFANVSPTGVAVTSAAGTPTITGFANVSPTGTSVTSSVTAPTVTGFANVAPTTVAVTAQVTAPTVTGVANVSPTGTSVTASAGTLTVSGQATATLTGVSVATATNAPTITGAANVSPTGNAVTSQASAPTVTGFANVSVTGVATTAQVTAPTVSAGGSVNVSPTGNAVSSQVSAPTVSGLSNVTLTGVAATTQVSAPTVSAAANVTLTGVSVGASSGSLTVNTVANVALTGVGLLLSTGSPGVTGNVASARLRRQPLFMANVGRLMN